MMQAVNAVPNGNNIVLGVTSIFFNGKLLNTGYATNWNALAAGLSTVPSRKIVAFYLADEPNLNGQSVADLTTATRAIHAIFPYPRTAIMTAFAVISSGWNPSLVQLYDWVGFDCYTNGSLTCNGAPYINTYNSLKAQIRADAKMYLIPQVSEPLGACCDSSLEIENAYMFSLAYSDPTIIAIFPFYWLNCPTCGANFALGLQSLPQLWPPQNQNGAAVALANGLANSWRYPTGTVPIVMTTTGNYLWSLNSPSLYLSGLAFFLYSNQQVGFVPVFKCSVVHIGKTGSYVSVLLMSASNCGGLPAVGKLLGYASPTANGGPSIGIQSGVSTSSAFIAYGAPVTVP